MQKRNQQTRKSWPTCMQELYQDPRKNIVSQTPCEDKEDVLNSFLVITQISSNRHRVNQR